MRFIRQRPKTLLSENLSLETAVLAYSFVRTFAINCEIKSIKLVEQHRTCLLILAILYDSKNYV